MSQDLLREFDSFYTPPTAPPPTRRAPPASLAPSHSRTYSSPLISPAFAVSNKPPRNGTQAPQIRARGATATTFDDIIYDPNDLESFYRPRNRNASLTRPLPSPRPPNFQRTSSTEEDPFDFFGPGGSGWAAAPPIQRPMSVSSAFDVFSQIDNGPLSEGSARGVGGAGVGHDFGDLMSSSNCTTPRQPLSARSFGSFQFPSAAPPTPRTPFGQLSLQTITPKPSPPSSSIATPPKATSNEPFDNNDDDFGEFIDSPSTNNPAPITFSHVPKKSSISLRKFAALPKPLPTDTTPNKSEPTIPQVAVLLTAFSPLFGLTNSHLLDKLKDLPFPLRQRVLAHQKTREFLESICEFGRVAGRIIAGRKRRQVKRSLPSKNKLSPALNSNWEQQKEEREAKEVCRIWKEGSGRLKAAMGTGGVPELDDEPLRGTTSRGACKLCFLEKVEVLPALKERTERLGWWDAEWGGHAGCKGFWEKHGEELRIK